MRLKGVLCSLWRMTTGKTSNFWKLTKYICVLCSTSQHTSGQVCTLLLLQCMVDRKTDYYISLHFYVLKSHDKIVAWPRQYCMATTHCLVVLYGSCNYYWVRTAWIFLLVTRSCEPGFTLSQYCEPRFTQVAQRLQNSYMYTSETLMHTFTNPEGYTTGEEDLIAKFVDCLVMEFDEIYSKQVKLHSLLQLLEEVHQYMCAELK